MPTRSCPKDEIDRGMPSLRILPELRCEIGHQEARWHEDVTGFVNAYQQKCRLLRNFTRRNLKIKEFR